MRTICIGDTDPELMDKSHCKKDRLNNIWLCDIYDSNTMSPTNAPILPIPPLAQAGAGFAQEDFYTEETDVMLLT
jgi:hypothetical protein